MRFPSISVTSSLLVLFAGCAGLQRSPLQGKDPNALFTSACATWGMGLQKVSGSVWLKARSNETSGQFPAVVSVLSPGELHMEVTNLLGGTEAILEVKNGKYTLKGGQSKKSVTQEGAGYWAGIPLEWATALFLGRVPCPSLEASKSARFALSEKGDELRVELPAQSGRAAETFAYRFRDWGGKLWPEALRWERNPKAGTNTLEGVTSVEFKFDDPEEGSGSPKRWEAVSAQGEIKVRWRDRQAL